MSVADVAHKHALRQTHTDALLLITPPPTQQGVI